MKKTPSRGSRSMEAPNPALIAFDKMEPSYVGSYETADLLTRHPSLVTFHT
jgi:hypothetical protein